MNVRRITREACGLALVLVVATVCLLKNTRAEERPADAAGGTAIAAASGDRSAKVGVLLVSHGSRSAAWRKMLLDFHDEVAPQLMKLPGVRGVKSAFMEYTEPSIATQLKAFDQAGYDEVVLVPLLLTVSSHSFDDIPTIIGAKEDAHSLASMKAEKIEQYSPKAHVTITPLLDFSELLEENLPRRFKALSRDAAREGVVLVAYGDEAYNEEWEDFFTKVEEIVCRQTGAAAATHCWCGHIVHYSREPTKRAIRQILKQHERSIVIPVLVARDEAFQDLLIGKAIEELAVGDRVAYVPDAILPDPKLTAWVIEATRTAMASRPALDSPAGEALP